jgi:hypothetical protein
MKQLNAAHGMINSSIGWKATQELIRSIQEKKGHLPCFRTDKAWCDRYDCRWRNDCKPGEM